MDKFLCLNCVKNFKDNEDLFVYNQYCTGFCTLLHAAIVQADAVKENEERKLEAA